jgi:mannose-1-phosphate guanylyltransferase
MALPKQFLSLVGDRTMLQLTVERIEGLVGISGTYIVAGEEFKEIILKQIPHLPPENVIIEPFGRDTAAAIGLAALVLGRENPRAVMLVLPADHYINDADRFREVLRGAAAAAGKGDRLVTLGITPHRPETGYGYIRRGGLYDTFGGIPAYEVERFLEKPDYERAREFLAGGDYLWNSGMFVWRIDLIRRLIAAHAPRLAAGLEEIGAALGTAEFPEVLARVYAELPKISVDYSILERADGALVMPGDFGWDDIGSWTALAGYAEKDAGGNVLEGTGVLLDTSGTLVFSPGKTAAVLGVEDLLIVNEEDSLLVCRKDRAQEVKKVVRALRDRGLEEVL